MKEVLAKIKAHRFFKLVAAGFLLAGSAISFFSNKQAVQADATRTFVRRTLSKNHVRGTVLVVKNGHPETVSYGYAWKGRRIGNGNDKVVYPTCSLQKVVTAAMMVQLINESQHTDHVITQNTKISRWFPKLKDANRVTVGELMSHTSGFSLTGTEVNQGKNLSETAAYDWIVGMINKTTELGPGQYFYNNANYILLAGIINKETGESYRTNFKNRIVKKLGLKATYLYPDIPKGKTDPISYSYSRGNYRDACYEKRAVASQLPGAANMFTTPREYYKILKALQDGQILDKSDFNYMTHLKSKVTSYCGGIYLNNNDSLMTAYGNLHDTHLGNWFQMTTDNQNGMIMFLNQTAGRENDNKDVGYQILQYIKPGTFTKR